MNSLKQDIQKLRAYEAAHSCTESKTFLEQLSILKTDER